MKQQEKPISNPFYNILVEIRNLMLLKKEILNIDDVALYTGFQKSYLYKLTSKRAIPHYKTPGGKSIFFKREEINDWLTQIKIKTDDEIQIEATLINQRIKRK
ncbi:MAG: helix-turn-helix domain-containing protein [Chryseobacterium sp.]